MKNLLLVGIGGLFGSVLRYSVTLFMKSIGLISWPFATISVNLLGSLLIGILIPIFLKNPNHSIQLLLVTGFCGGFTTFSTFSLDLLSHHQNGNLQHVVGYLTLSVIGGFLLCLFGYWFSHKWLA